jgi:hypothetical protein
LAGTGNVKRRPKKCPLGISDSHCSRDTIFFCRNHAHKVTLHPIEKSPWVICGLHLQELAVHQLALTVDSLRPPPLRLTSSPLKPVPHHQANHYRCLPTCATPNRRPPSSPTSSTYNKHSLDFHTIPAYTQPQQLTATPPFFTQSDPQSSQTPPPK